MVEFKGKVDASYLDALKASVQDIKERSYALLGLGPGGSVLDVGCGPATDTIALAAAVAPGGRVVGVDFDPDMIEIANARAEEAGLVGTVTHQVADAQALPFADGAFDACRSERVFQHLPDPVHALAELVRVTRPGGRIVVLDTDHFTRIVDTPERDTWHRLSRYMCEHMIASPWAARQLYAWFRRAGLEGVTAEMRGNIVHDLDFAWGAGMMDAVGAGAVAAGEVTQADFERLRASMEAAAAGGTFFGSWPVVMVAGTKPAV